MKAKNLCLSMTAAAALIFSLNVHATTSTMKVHDHASMESAASESNLKGKVASVPGSLTDAQFKSGLSIDQSMSSCKESDGFIDKIKSVNLKIHDRMHLVIVSGSKEQYYSPPVGQYKRSPSKEQLQSLVGLEFCNIDMSAKQ